MLRIEIDVEASTEVSVVNVVSVGIVKIIYGDGNLCNLF